MQQEAALEQHREVDATTSKKMLTAMLQGAWAAMLPRRVTPLP
jgi:hypothetical protein